MSHEFQNYPKQPGRDGYVVLNRRVPGTYLLVRRCPFCRQDSQVVVPAQGLWDWEHGKHPQVAFPTLSDAEREIVMTGIHAECWIPEPDEDEWAEEPEPAEFTPEEDAEYGAAQLAAQRAEREDER